jgi:hypothetical protein
MTERRSDKYYSELEERLRSLMPLAARLLSPEVVKWYTEYLDAGEYGLAVEVAAEGLPADARRSQFRELAVALLAEAEVMGVAEPAADRLRALAAWDP